MPSARASTAPVCATVSAASRIPTGRQRQRYREGGAVAVNHIQAQRGWEYAAAIFPPRCADSGWSPRRPPHSTWNQPGPCRQIVIAEVGGVWTSSEPARILRQLPDLLFERHLLQQRLNARIQRRSKPVGHSGTGAAWAEHCRETSRYRQKQQKRSGTEKFGLSKSFILIRLVTVVLCAIFAPWRSRLRRTAIFARLHRIRRFYDEFLRLFLRHIHDALASTPRT